jgi:hypothetical protein
MLLAWSYIGILLVYFFARILRKEREKKRAKERPVGE